MLNPIWVGKFDVAGPRDNKFLSGYASASVWVAARVADADALAICMEAAMKTVRLSVVSSCDVQRVVDELKLSAEIRELLPQAKRTADTAICGTFHGYEKASRVSPSLLQLKTERLLLRPWTRHDRGAFAAMNADREVLTFAMTREQSDRAIDRYLSDFEVYGFSFLVAEMRSTRAFAGIMGLQVMHDILPGVPQPAFEMGIRLNREHQGQGLATEGGKAVLDLAFHSFQFSEVVAIAAVANTPARRVMEKLGMQHRADLTFDHPRFPANHLYKRHTLYQLQNPQPLQTAVNAF